MKEYAYVCVIFKEARDREFEREQGMGTWEGLEGRKGKGKMMCSYFN